jgi:hypothetical protein
MYSTCMNVGCGSGWFFCCKSAKDKVNEWGGVCVCVCVEAVVGVCLSVKRIR